MLAYVWTCAGAHVHACRCVAACSWARQQADWRARSWQTHQQAVCNMRYVNLFVGVHDTILMCVWVRIAYVGLCVVCVACERVTLSTQDAQVLSTPPPNNLAG